MANLIDRENDKNVLWSVLDKIRGSIDARIKLAKSDESNIWGALYHRALEIIADTKEVLDKVDAAQLRELIHICADLSKVHDIGSLTNPRTAEDRAPEIRELFNRLEIYANKLPEAPRIEPIVFEKPQRFREINTTTQHRPYFPQQEETAQVVVAAHQTTSALKDIELPSFVSTNPRPKQQPEKPKRVVEPLIPEEYIGERKPAPKPLVFEDKIRMFPGVTEHKGSDFDIPLELTRRPRPQEVKRTPIDIPLDEPIRGPLPQPRTEEEKMRYLAEMIGRMVKDTKTSEMDSPIKYMFDERDMFKKPYWGRTVSRAEQERKYQRGKKFIRTFSDCERRLYRLFHDVIDFLSREYPQIDNLPTMEKVFKYLDSINKCSIQLRKMYKNVKSFDMMYEAETRACEMIQGLEMYFYEQEMPKKFKK